MLSRQFAGFGPKNALSGKRDDSALKMDYAPFDPTSVTSQRLLIGADNIPFNEPLDYQTTGHYWPGSSSLRVATRKL
jgi:hypothetical protein